MTKLAPSDLEQQAEAYLRHQAEYITFLESQQNKFFLYLLTNKPILDALANVPDESLGRWMSEGRVPGRREVAELELQRRRTFNEHK